MRRALARTAWGVGVLAAALILAVAALGVWLWALYLFLAPVMAPPAAAFLTGLAALLGAGGLTWLGFRTATR